MDEIEKNMEVGDNFYSIAMKMPINEVFKLLLEDYSFNDAFRKQDELLNVICAEQDYLSLGKNKIDVDINNVFKKLEILLTKKIYDKVRNNIDFELSDLHIHYDLQKNMELDCKILNNFNLLKDSIDKNKEKWLMKCLSFKQYRNIIKKEDIVINKDAVSKLSRIYMEFNNNN